MDTRVARGEIDFGHPDFICDAQRADAAPDAPSPLLASVVDQLALGIAVLAVDGTVLHANRAALAALRAGGLRIAADSTIHSSRAGDRVALHAALAATIAHRRSLLVLGGEMHPVTIAVQPLLDGSRLRAGRALLVFGKATGLCPRAAIVPFARARSLTPAETAVLEALGDGLRPKQVAVRVRSSIATVRSHLRSIYAKTHARNLQDLLSRLAALPPVAE